MKTKILALSLVASLFIISCTKDNPADNPISATDVSLSGKIDNVADDVAQIAESQSNENPSIAGRNSNSTASLLSSCATVTTVQTGNTWIRTIDFGNTNCITNIWGHVRGKIIITFTNDFTAATRTISYTFDNFYHNDRHVEGNQTVVRTILNNGHPQSTINMNMTITNPDGGIYKRVGTRVRECTVGYDTPNSIFDNVYFVTGSWTTTLPNGNTHTATIGTPLVINLSCTSYPNIVSGTITFEKAHTTAILDYGNGDCDANATITINGVVHNITL
jgi:hypothetical protein